MKKALSLLLSILISVSAGAVAFALNVSAPNVVHYIETPQKYADICLVKTQYTANAGENVDFRVDLESGFFKTCHTFTGVEIETDGGTKVLKTNESSGSFVMPDYDVVITVLYSTSHVSVATREPDCFKYGCRYCEVCLEEIEGTEVPAYGHIGTWEVVERPTENKPGLRRIDCYRCGGASEVIPAKYDVDIEGSSRNTVDYRTTVVFHAYWCECPTAQLVWNVNGKEFADDGGMQYEVKEAKENLTVFVTVKETDGNAAYESAHISVTIKNTSFFAKLAAFFRYLFKKPPVVDITDKK